jgi:hypothetical protein
LAEREREREEGTTNISRSVSLGAGERRTTKARNTSASGGPCGTDNDAAGSRMSAVGRYHSIQATYHHVAMSVDRVVGRVYNRACRSVGSRRPNHRFQASSTISVRRRAWFWLPERSSEDIRWAVQAVEDAARAVVVFFSPSGNTTPPGTEGSARNHSESAADETPQSRSQAAASTTMSTASSRCMASSRATISTAMEGRCGDRRRMASNTRHVT